MYLAVMKGDAKGGFDVNKMKELREKLGLTQEDVAKQLSVGRTAVTLWENGTNKPQASRLLPLARILKCSVEDLLAE